jgi:dUTPase
MNELQIALDPGAKIPTRDAGSTFTLYAMSDHYLLCGDWVTVNTGVHLNIPPGVCALIKSRPGLFIRQGIFTDGIVPAGYTDAIKVRLNRIGGQKKAPYHIHAGDSIAQLIFIRTEMPTLRIDEDEASKERWLG